MCTSLDQVYAIIDQQRFPFYSLHLYIFHTYITPFIFLFCNNNLILNKTNYLHLEIFKTWNIEVKKKDKKIIAS